MGYNNARFYCLEHPTRIGQGYCKECKSPMCSQCLKEDSDFCPACRRELFLRSDKYVSKRELLVTLIGGIIGFLGSYLFFDTQLPENIWQEYGWKILYLTTFGISLFYTFILYSNSGVIEELSSVPFISWKLTLIVYAASALSLIPAIIYLYKVILYFTTYRQRRA